MKMPFQFLFLLFCIWLYQHKYQVNSNIVRVLSIFMIYCWEYFVNWKSLISSCIILITQKQTSNTASVWGFTSWKRKIKLILDVNKRNQSSDSSATSSLSGWRAINLFFIFICSAYIIDIARGLYCSAIGGESLWPFEFSGGFCFEVDPCTYFVMVFFNLDIGFGLFNSCINAAMIFLLSTSWTRSRWRSLTQYWLNLLRWI